MDQDIRDRGWQELQERIDRLLSPYRSAGLIEKEYRHGEAAIPPEKSYGSGDPYAKGS